MSWRLGRIEATAITNCERLLRVLGLEGRLGDVTRTIIATPVRTPDDLIVRAAMAVHWNQFRLIDPAYPRPRHEQ